jgi:hypothetical protein
MRIEIVIRLVALLLAALATGGLMVNWIGLTRAMARISSAAALSPVWAARWRLTWPLAPKPQAPHAESV